MRLKRKARKKKRSLRLKTIDNLECSKAPVREANWRFTNGATVNILYYEFSNYFMQFLKKISTFFSITIVAGIFLFSIFLVQAQTNTNVSCSENLDGKSDRELELALKKCEQEIEEQKNMLNNKQRESVTIERDISILDYKIVKTKSDIRARDIKIRRLKKTITQKGDKISELSEKTESIKTSLGALLRKSDELESYSLVETLLSNDSLSDFLIDIDNFNVLNDELRISLSRVRNLKEEIKVVKVDLEEKERNERGLKLTKEKEKRKTVNYKSEKERLLGLNRKEEKQYKQTIAEKEKIKNEIRNRIFRTVGGTEMTFNEALQLILPFEERIGVEASLVLAVLTQESAIDGVIGRNLGRCTYNQSAKNKSGTVMSDSQKPAFLAIIKELGMNANITPVSCPIPRDGQYGGAMGPSQFMPRTWWDAKTGYGYKRRVAKVLGVAVPSPFVNLDAFVGTALYLSDARDKCAGPNGFSSTFKIWGCTAAKYYSGLGSSGSRLSRHMNPTYSYGYKVAKRAQGFQKDIETLGL